MEPSEQERCEMAVKGCFVKDDYRLPPPAGRESYILSPSRRKYAPVGRWL